MIDQMRYTGTREQLFAKGQRNLGCPTCRHADPAKLGNDACCGHYAGPDYQINRGCRNHAPVVQAEED